MTMKELMRQYFMGEIDAISLIRMLSGMFDPKNAASLLSLICTITRHEQGDIDTETFNEIWKFGIDLKFNKGDYPAHYDTMPMEALKEELEKMKAEQDKQYTKIVESDNSPNAEESADEVALEHDISLLVSYLMYRERKNERDSEDESERQTES